MTVDEKLIDVVLYLYSVLLEEAQHGLLALFAF